MNSDKTSALVNHNSLSAGLALLDEIPLLDLAVQRLIEALSDDNLGERELANIIDQCPSLSGKIVGLANSAYFRRSKPISSLKDAIVLIGMRTVKSFAIASALQDPFSNSNCPAFRPGSYWLHDILTAQAARELSKKVSKKHGLHPEEAYLAGLLHNIGLLALAHLFPVQLNKILENNGLSSEEMAVQIETEFGVNYFLIGAALLKHWHLPEAFIDIAKNFASSDYQGNNWALSRVVGVAHEWADHIIRQENSVAFNSNGLKQLGISTNDAEAVRSKCLEQLNVYIELSEIISGEKPEFFVSTTIADATHELKDRLVNTIDSLSSIRALSDLNIRNKTENEILGDALKILMDHQDMQRCSIFLNRDNLLVNVSGLSWDEHFTSKTSGEGKAHSAHTFSVGEGIVGMVAESGEMRHAKNCNEDPMFKSMEKDFEYLPGSLICVPVCFQGETLGVLNISHTEPNVFNDWHERFLLVYANMLGQLLVYNRVILDMDDTINQRTNELQIALARAETLSTRDELTGIHNRRYFISHASKLIKQCERYKYKAAVLMIDIDNFKLINDTYGHLEGDRALAKVAEAISQCARDADIVARLGGEEFICALQHTDNEKAEQVANRILDKIRQLECGEKGKYKITASVGISCYDGSTTSSVKSLEVWMAESDKALYEAKQSGKDRIVLYKE